MKDYFIRTTGNGRFKYPGYTKQLHITGCSLTTEYNT